MTQVFLEECKSGFFFIYAAINTWVIDSRATNHMTTNDPSFLNSLIPSPIKFV